MTLPHCKELNMPKVKKSVTLKNGKIATRTTERTYTHVIYALDLMPNGTLQERDQYGWKKIHWANGAANAQKVAQAIRSSYSRYNSYLITQGKEPYNIVEVVVQEVSA